jgi:hypothetical protein
MKSSSKGPRSKQQLSESLSGKLSGYALAAGATAAGMLGMIHPADAEVVFTPTNDSFPPDFFDVVDLNHDGAPDFRFDLYSVQYRIFYVGLVASAREPNAMMVSAGGYVSVLSKGAAIGPHQVFAHDSQFRFALSVGFDGTTSTSAAFARRKHRVKPPNAHSSRHFGPWWGVQDKYAGVAFTIGSEIHYGWIRLTLTPEFDRFAVTMTGYAYEKVADRQIHAGQISGESDDDDSAAVSPKRQTSLGMLAVGSVGLPLWRDEADIGRIP